MTELDVSPLKLYPIPSFPKYYATIDGKIISTKWGKLKELKCHKEASGYMRVGLSVNKKCKSMLVHRAILSAKLGKVLPSDLQVNHINRDKEDNSMANLELVTRAENVRKYAEGKQTSKENS